MNADSPGGPVERIVSLHRCKAGDEWTYGGYGVAVDACWELDDGELWVGNGEYATRVNYCPFCGFAARSKVQSNTGGNQPPAPNAG